MDLWFFEKEATVNGYREIAGIDEAGRGPLAGPVVSAAVVLPPAPALSGVMDSKKLSAKKRAGLYDKIYTLAHSIGIGIVDPVEIDRVNILQASLLAMAMAVDNLHPQPDCLLIDGTFCIPSQLPQKPIIKGDSLSVSIAAASIIAKVTRDRLMESYHFPNTASASIKDIQLKPTKPQSANSAIRQFIDAALRASKNTFNQLTDLN
jgi:ribonuclease HII